MPDPKILDKLQKRAAARRKSDADLPGAAPDGPITYAYGLLTGKYYIGYRGGANRKRRVRDDVDAIQAGEKNVYSCSEAAASAIAVKQGENIGDLVFASFGINGEPVSPCDICKTWLPRAYGYYEHDGSWVEEPWR